MVMELNELEQPERNLRESPDALADIIGSSMDAILAVDDAQRIILFNAAAEKMFRCPADEVMGNSVERFIPQRFRAGHRTRVHDFDKSGVTNRTVGGLATLWGLRATGEEFPIEASISKVVSGGKKYFTVVIRDITERKRTEETLRKSEEQFRLATQAGKMYSFEWDVTTDRVLRSSEHVGVLGVKEPLHITHQQFMDKVHPDDRPKLITAIAGLSPEKPTCNVSYRVLVSDGAVVWIRSNGRAFFDGEGRMLRLVGMVVDITDQKLAEEKLKEYEKAVEGSEEMICVVDREYRYRIANRQFLKMRGMTKEQVVGCSAKEVLNKGFFEGVVKAKLDESFEGKVVRYETKYMYPELGERDVLVSYFPIEGANGIDRVACTVQDITERKRAEEALRVSEERLRLAQRAAHIGAFEWDFRTDVNTWTPEQEALYGLAPGNFGGTYAAFERLVHPDDRTRLKELVEATLKTGQPMKAEWRVVWPDGNVHWLAAYWQLLTKDSGDSSRVIGVNIDVTERKRAEEALRESEERFRLVANTAPVMIWMSGLDRKPTYFNQLWLDFTGLSETDLQNGLDGIVHPDDYPQCYEVYCRGFDQRRPFRKECRLRRHDGQYRWILDIGVPRFHEDGSFAGYIGSCIDVTDHKLAEEALSGMTRKLVEAQEQERARIARELHDDINQRLAMLAVELEQLKENPSEIESRVQDLRKQTAEISNDVQALSHDLHSSQLEYLGVVGGMKSWCKEFAERQKLEIDFRSDVSSVLPGAVGLSLFRVLQEALSNAIKHSGVKQIEVQLREDSREIHLVIRDLGRGFDVEVASQGKGLGLTSMRERVRLVNGTISIESKSMSGTTIHVLVPLRSEHTPEQEAGLPKHNSRP